MRIQYLLGFFFAFSACHAVSETKWAPVEPPRLQGFDEVGSADFVVQRLNHSFLRSKLKNRVSTKAKKWYLQNRLRHSNWRQSPELVLQDVILADSQISILGSEAFAEIHPDFQGHFENLVLRGVFKNRGGALPINDFLFSFEPHLLQQTFIGKAPQARILLDQSVLLQVVSSNENEIIARLDTTAVPDFYLKGLHRISVEYGNYYTDGLIKIGEPVETDNLSPIIERSEVVYENNKKPRFIRLYGKHFMVNPKFSYALVDGEFAFGFQTDVLDNGSAETLIHIPDPRQFDIASQHEIMYATPFGVTLASVERGQQ